MFALRLVHLTQEHADKLSEGLLARLWRSGRCGDLLSSVPPSELQHRTYEIYRNLTDWMFNKTESEIKEKYIGIGPASPSRCSLQSVPLCNPYDQTESLGLPSAGRLAGARRVDR